MQVDGMFRRLLLGPLLTQSVKTKDYYKRNGQAFINTADQGGTVHFMTGLLLLYHVNYILILCDLIVFCFR